ncbi:hypothetical protein Lal_00046420 [Lupinus albus]|nr:hypothetical protein Lal_00046420 [Lupinus albus]
MLFLAQARQLSLRRESSSIPQDFTLPSEPLSPRREYLAQAKILQYSPCSFFHKGVKRKGISCASRVLDVAFGGQEASGSRSSEKIPPILKTQIWRSRSSERFLLKRGSSSALTPLPHPGEPNLAQARILQYIPVFHSPSTARTKIDVHADTLSMKFGDKLAQFNIFDALRHPYEDHYFSFYVV